MRKRQESGGSVAERIAGQEVSIISCIKKPFWTAILLDCVCLRGVLVSSRYECMCVCVLQDHINNFLLCRNNKLSNNNNSSSNATLHKKSLDWSWSMAEAATAPCLLLSALCPAPLPSTTALLPLFPCLLQRKRRNKFPAEPHFECAASAHSTIWYYTMQKIIISTMSCWDILALNKYN